MKVNSRREFLKIAIVSLPVMTLANLGLVNKAFAEDLKLVDEKSATAAALGYVHDATKADIVKFPKRKGADGEKQFCSNCALLTQAGVSMPGQQGEWGKCAIFPGAVVNTKGWCNSWAPKA